MTDQPDQLSRQIDLATDDTDTDSDTDAAVSAVSAAWTPGSERAGLDERVEFTYRADGVLVRDPRYPEGPHLRFSPEQWTALLAGPPAAVVDARDPDAVLDLRENSDLSS